MLFCFAVLADTHPNQIVEEEVKSFLMLPLVNTAWVSPCRVYNMNRESYKMKLLTGGTMCSFSAFVYKYR